MPSVLICCDASSEIGFGHVYRCLALADHLRQEGGTDVLFAMAESPLGFDLVRRAHFPLLLWDRDRFADRASWLRNTARQENIDLLFFDLREDLPADFFRGLRQEGRISAGLDVITSSRLHLDLVFDPPRFSGHESDGSAFQGKWYQGWEYVVLRPQFFDHYARRPHRPERILVTMGGSDPAGMTEAVLEALCLAGGGFQADILLGPGFQRQEAVRRLLQGALFVYRIHPPTDRPAERMAQADMAVASFGMTAYELAAMGVPTIFLCLSPLHRRRAQGFEKQGLAKCLGLLPEVSKEHLAAEIQVLLHDQEQRRRMSQAGCRLGLTGGARKITEILLSALSNSRAHRSGKEGAIYGA